MNFGICIESSHQKGMGHLFRALNFAELIRNMHDKCLMIVNDDTDSIAALRARSADFVVEDLNDTASDWESSLIGRYAMDVWVNDRLDTSLHHAKNVRKNRIKLVSIDDRGPGAEFTDINFGTLPCVFDQALQGSKVLKGLEYLILNKNIEQFKRRRNAVKRIVVTMGGSDTYGITIKVIEILRRHNIKADILAGPCFAHWEELKKVLDADYPLVKCGASLIEDLYRYDLAITAGGITPFEANASGLPCIIIASEPHEVSNGMFLDKLGSSVFAGYYRSMRGDVFAENFDIAQMSEKGLSAIRTDGANNVYTQIACGG